MGGSFFYCLDCANKTFTKHTSLAFLFLLSDDVFVAVEVYASAFYFKFSTRVEDHPDP